MGNNIALAESAATVYDDQDQGEQQKQEIADVEKDSGGDDAPASEEQSAGEEKEAGDGGDGESKEGSEEQAGGEEKEKEKEEGDGDGEKSGEGGEGEGGEEQQEEEPEEELRVTVDDVKTAPMDFRFPTTNQARHCYTRYNEFHKCAADKGEDAPECAKFAKFYRSLCPGDWIDKWNEERETGTFAGRY